jgi:hypothetical protein
MIATTHDPVLAILSEYVCMNDRGIVSFSGNVLVTHAFLKVYIGTIAPQTILLRGCIAMKMRRTVTSKSLFHSPG